MLKNALRAGVVEELAARNEPFLHRHFAPGTEAIREIGHRRDEGDVRRRRIRHARHCHRASRTLSAELLGTCRPEPTKSSVVLHDPKVTAENVTACSRWSVFHP